LVFSQSDSTPLHTDNTSVIHIATNPVYHEHTKHIEVGEVAGLTSEGQPGLLKEFLGQIVVENHGRRGSHVINES
jgi:hypothetical protein